MVGMNEKGGMNDEEFECSVNNSIVPLFPDLKDTPGKRILLKVDSGPGRNGQDLLNKCRFRGIFIYPGLPNATSSVQQKTDINYGQCLEEPSKNCNNMLRQGDHHVPKNFNIWVNYLRWSLP